MTSFARRLANARSRAAARSRMCRYRKVAATNRSSDIECVGTSRWSRLIPRFEEWELVPRLGEGPPTATRLNGVFHDLVVTHDGEMH